MSKNHRSGYAIAQEKITSLEQEVKQLRIKVAEKDGIIERQSTRISELTVQCEAAYTTAGDNYALAKQYWNHMGWFRRWLWDRRQAKK